MADTVFSKPVDEEVGALALHDFGTPVSLTSNQDYICPSDGIVRIAHVGGTTDFYELYVNTILMLMDTSTKNSSTPSSDAGVFRFASALSVRKGMTIKYTGNHVECLFLPYV